ncbi:protein of unknown function [Magnetospirillum sp. XM-1]|nr:protein of unknown function [Magnetospirillum sp. XM-1]
MPHASAIPPNGRGEMGAGAFANY